MTLIQSKKKIIKIINLVVDKVLEKDLFSQAASLSYYCALSLAPLLILMISFLSFLGEQTISEFINQVNNIVGKDAGEVVSSIINSTKKSSSVRTVSEVIGTIILVFSASSVFSQLRTTINSIFMEKAPCDISYSNQGIVSWIKEKIFSIGIMIGFIFISISSLLLTIVISVFLYTGEGLVIEIINQIIFLSLYTLVFTLVFYFLPQKKRSKSDTFLGGFIAALLFIVGKFLIGLYLGKAAVGSAYGAAGSLIVLLIWVYYSSFIFFIAGLITSCLPEIRKIKRGSL